MESAGLKICDNLFSDSASDADICTEGMYHQFILSMVDKEYGLSLEQFRKTNDLYFYCQNQPKEHLGACYFDFVPLWTQFFGDNREAAVAYVVNNTDDIKTNGERIFDTFARSFIQQDIVTGSYEKSIIACHSAPSSLQEACMEGLVYGFAEHGLPNEQYKEGFKFCRNSLLTQQEHNWCFEDMTWILAQRYDKTHMQVACDTLSNQEKFGECLPQLN